MNFPTAIECVHQVTLEPISVYGVPGILPYMCPRPALSIKVGQSVRRAHGVGRCGKSQDDVASWKSMTGSPFTYHVTDLSTTVVFDVTDLDLDSDPVASYSSTVADLLKKSKINSSSLSSPGDSNLVLQCGPATLALRVSCGESRCVRWGGLRLSMHDLFWPPSGQELDAWPGCSEEEPATVVDYVVFSCDGESGPLPPPLVAFAGTDQVDIWWPEGLAEVQVVAVECIEDTFHSVAVGVLSRAELEALYVSSDAASAPPLCTVNMVKDHGCEFHQANSALASFCPYGAVTLSLSSVPKRVVAPDYPKPSTADLRANVSPPSSIPLPASSPPPPQGVDDDIFQQLQEHVNDPEVRLALRKAILKKAQRYTQLFDSPPSSPVGNSAPSPIVAPAAPPMHVDNARPCICGSDDPQLARACPQHAPLRGPPELFSEPQPGLGPYPTSAPQKLPLLPKDTLGYRLVAGSFAAREFAVDALEALAAPLGGPSAKTRPKNWSGVGLAGGSYLDSPHSTLVREQARNNWHPRTAAACIQSKGSPGRQVDHLVPRPFYYQHSALPDSFRVSPKLRLSEDASTHNASLESVDPLLVKEAETSDFQHLLALSHALPYSSPRYSYPAVSPNVSPVPGTPASRLRSMGRLHAQLAASRVDDVASAVARSPVR